MVRIGAVGEDIGKILDISDSCKNIFDYSPRQMINKDINIIMPSMIARIHKYILIKNIERGKEMMTNQKREFYAINKNKDLFSISIYVTLSPNLKNGLLSIYIIYF